MRRGFSIQASFLLFAVITLAGCERRVSVEPTSSGHDVSGKKQLSPSSCSPTLPGSDLSVPAWVDRDEGAPFEVRQYLEAWQAAHTDAECLYISAMAEVLATMRTGDGEAEKSKRHMLQAFIEELQAICPNDEPPPPEMDALRARKVSEFVQPVFSTIDKAQQYDTCVFSPSLRFTQLIEHLQGARVIAKLNLIELRLLRQSPSDFNAVELVLRRLLRMARDLQPRGALMGQLVAYVVERMALESVRTDILTRPDLSPDQCERVLSVLEQHEQLAIDHLEEGTRAEYVMAGNSLWEIQQGISHPDDVGLEGLSPEALAAINFGAEWAELNEVYAMLLEYIREPYDQVLKMDRFDQEVSARKKRAHDVIAERQISNGKFDKSTIVIMLLPAMSQAREACARLQVRREATKAMVRIRRYELEHGSPPETLDEVYSGSTVPQDPYSAQPLRYHVEGDRLLVYSIGKDQVDDMGQIDWDYGQQPGDFIIEMPALRR